MVKKALLSLCGFCLLLASLAAEPQEKFQFTLNGKRIEPRILRVGGGESPEAGDIVVVNHLPLTLDGPGNYDFEGSEQEPVLYRVMPGGRTRLVSCRVGPTGEVAQDQRLLNLSEEDAQQIRGVKLETWTPAWEAWLHKLDAARVMVVLGEGAMQDGGNRLPELPATLRYLELSSSSSGGFEDMGRLRQLRQLRFLSLSDISPSRFDFAAVADLPLEYFSLPWCREAQHVEALGGLKTLKTLVADYCDYLGRADWLSGLVELRQLQVGRIYPLDRKLIVPLNLRSLESLPKLRSLDAAISPVAALPQITLPALRSANLLLTKVHDSKVIRFAEMNPQCEVRHSLNAELSAALKPVDLLKIRTGGSLQRREKLEITFQETRDPQVIAGLIAHLKVYDNGEGGHCMCVGEPTFEFYGGDQLLAEISYHHGRAIRWGRGGWPADGVLTDESATYLKDWLDRHGHPQAREAMEALVKKEDAERQRSERLRMLLPWKVTDAMLAGEMPEEFIATLKAALPDARDQATLFLKLLGCNHHCWSMEPPFERRILTEWMVALPPEAVAAAIRRGRNSTDEGEGAAHWVFGAGNYKAWEGEGQVLEPLSRLALSHPLQPNRWRAMAALREMGDAPSVDGLRFMLEGGYVIRSFLWGGSKAELTEAPQRPPERDRSIDLPAGASDALAAAWCLALLRDKPSQDDVEKLVSRQTPEMQAAFQQSLKSARERQGSR